MAKSVSKRTRTAKRAKTVRAKAASKRPAAGSDTLWEVFVRPANGLAHRHMGSIHASDAEMALQNARDAYTRRGEGVSIWVVPSASIRATTPAQRSEFIEPAADKIYRHPSFYNVPDEIEYM